MSLLHHLEGVLKTDLRSHIKNGGWLVIGSGIVSALSLIMSIVFANALSKESFGDYRYALGLLNVFNSFSLSGMNTAVAQAVARGFDGTLAASVRYQFKWAIPHALGGLVAAAIFWSQGNTLAALCLGLFAVFIPSSNALNTYSGFLQGRKLFSTLSTTTIIQSLAVYALVTIAVFSTRDALWLTVALITATILSNITVFSWVMWRFKPKEATDPQAITYGRNLSFLWGLRLAAEQIETFLIHGFLGPAALATFAVITTAPERLKGYIKIAPSIVLPNHANRTLAEIVPPLRKKMLLMGLGLVIISIVYILLCPLLFGWVYPLYSDAVPLAQLYGISLILGLWQIPSAIFQSQQEASVLGKILASSSIFQALIMGIGVIAGGLFGAVLGKLIFQALQLTLFVTGLEYLAKRQETASIK